MDDLELEARLRTRLHTRFDDAPVPPELASNVAQALATGPASVGTFDLRFRGRWLGWSAVAAAVAVAVVAITLSSFTLPSLPGNRSTPSPEPTMPGDRYFILLPPAGVPAKPATSLAGDILAARLRALGIGTFTSAGGYALTFTVPGDGPSDDSIRAVLGATGDVEFVPLPPADYYADGPLEAIVGEPLPKDEPALFGWEGIESVAIDDTQQVPAITITLKPAAKDAFADFTTAHATETLAIVLDGRVALLPIINEPITGGQVSISGGSLEPTFDRTAAILVGGMLPEGWRGATVPVIVSFKLAVSAALAEFPGATVSSWDLNAMPEGDGWRAVWNVVVSRDDLANEHLPCPTPGPSSDNCRSPGPSRRVVVDAERGTIIQIEVLPAGT